MEPFKESLKNNPPRGLVEGDGREVGVEALAAHPGLFLGNLV